VPKREGRISAKLARRGSDEREFDERFWREIEPSKRLEMLWDMVLELDAWRGG
jgi:hypothetical protein